MSRLIALLILAGSLAGTVAPALGQDQDPYELMRDLDHKLTEAAGFTYTATREGHGTVATTLTRTGKVTASLHDADLKLRIEGSALNTDGTKPKFLSVYDGDTVTSIHYADHEVVTGTLDYTFGVLGTAGAGLSSWLLLWNDHLGGAFRDGNEPYTLKYKGQALVEDEACYVIRIGFDEYGGVEEYESWIYLDTDTLLPKRIEFGTYGEDASLGLVTLTFDRMTMLDTLDDSTFEVEPPADFEAIAYESPEDNFGGGQLNAPEPQGVAVGEMAPEWSLEDPDGNDYALSDLRGRVVVMDFWATWCGPCRMAMPGMQKLHEEFKDQPVSVLGINCWESGDPESFMAGKGLDYGLLVNGDNVANAYGVSGIPTFYVIGKDGKVVHHEVGYDPDGEARLREIIKEALAE